MPIYPKQVTAWTIAVSETDIDPMSRFIAVDRGTALLLTQIEALFVQVLVLAREMRCLKLGNVALDGTKIAADASKQKVLSGEHANRIETQLREEVQLLLKLAEESDTRPVNDGLNVLAEIARREKRSAAIVQAKAKIEARARERQAVEQQEYQARCAKHGWGRKKGGVCMGFASRWWSPCSESSSA